jgi:DNA-binding XRE family transcriptional regulator
MDEQLPRRTLRQWREKVYFETQEEFAQRLGVHETAISLWETGRRHPRLRTRRIIAERLGLKPQQIIFEGDEE